jgi:hypothetical protein
MFYEVFPSINLTTGRAILKRRGPGGPISLLPRSPVFGANLSDQYGNLQDSRSGQTVSSTDDATIRTRRASVKFTELLADSTLEELADMDSEDLFDGQPLYDDDPRYDLDNNDRLDDNDSEKEGRR